MTQLQALLQEDCEKQQQQRACRRRDFVGRRQSSRLPTAAESSQQQQTMVFSAVELADASALCASNEKRRRSLGRLQLLEEQQCCRPSIRAARRVLVAILACAASASRNALPLPKPWLGRTCQQDESAARRRPAACCRQTLILPLPLPLSMLLLLLLLQSRGSEPSDAPHSSAVAAAYVGLSSTTSHRTMPLARSRALVGACQWRRRRLRESRAGQTRLGPREGRVAEWREARWWGSQAVSGTMAFLCSRRRRRAGPGRVVPAARRRTLTRSLACPPAREPDDDAMIVRVCYFTLCAAFGSWATAAAAAPTCQTSSLVVRLTHTHSAVARSLALSVGGRRQRRWQPPAARNWSE